MGEVIGLRTRKRVLAVMGTDVEPRPAAKWKDQFWDLDNWRVSKKGNRYIEIEGCYVTVFRNGDWWWWSISERGMPWYSNGGCESEHEARHDAARELGGWLVERERGA